MDISEIRKISFDGDREVHPWIDPVTVTGIDQEASKKLHKSLWYALHSGTLNPDQYDPECDAKTIFNYVRDCVSWWIYLYELDKTPEELSSITTYKVIIVSIFFIRFFGYPMAGILSSMVKCHSNKEMNKPIFDLYKTAFEEEAEPHLKWCLQDNFLDFFGYLPAFTDVHNKTNWDGLSEEDLAYLSHLHTHRMREPTTLLAP